MVFPHVVQYIVVLIARQVKFLLEFMVFWNVVLTPNNCV